MGKTLERALGREQAQALLDQVRARQHLSTCCKLRTRLRVVCSFASGFGAHSHLWFYNWRLVAPRTMQIKVGSVLAITGRVQPHLAKNPPSSAPAGAGASTGGGRQLRADVVDVVCSSVAILHKSR